EDDHIRVAKEIDERFARLRIGKLVFRIGRVDNGAAARLEAITIGITAVVLPYERNRHPGNRMARVRLEPEKFDRGAKRRVIHRKRWRRLLPAQRALEG